MRTLLQRELLLREGVSLLIREPGGGPFDFAFKPDTLRIPASNAKLVTSYVALRELTANHRWRTDLYLIQEQSGPAQSPRQGLLVVGGGDPTMRREDLQAMALQLRLSGISQIDGALYYDDRLFAGPIYPLAWGNVDEALPWYAPVSPYVLNLNRARFLLVVDPTDQEVEVIPRQFLPNSEISTRFTWIEAGKEAVELRQLPSADHLSFSLSGDLIPKAHKFSLTAAIMYPVDHFFRQLRAVLHEAGIRGEMPVVRFTEAFPTQEPIYQHHSRPLGTFLSEVNKESNNLVAEVLLRSLAFRDQVDQVGAQDGLRVVQEVVAHDFPQHTEAVSLVDGSGLGRKSRVTASFLVALLERVLGHFEFRAEYLNSLSVGGWDGTLQNRRFARRHWGRLRAKSGTLRGVQNLAGYFSFGDRVLLFAFLIQDDRRDQSRLRAAQDRVVTGILDYVMGKSLPLPSVKRFTPSRGAPPLPPVPAPKRSTLRTVSAE